MDYMRVILKGTTFLSLQNGIHACHCKREYMPVILKEMPFSQFNSSLHDMPLGLNSWTDLTQGVQYKIMLGLCSQDIRGSC